MSTRYSLFNLLLPRLRSRVFFYFTQVHMYSLFERHVYGQGVGRRVICRVTPTYVPTTKLCYSQTYLFGVVRFGRGIFKQLTCPGALERNLVCHDISTPLTTIRGLMCFLSPSRHLISNAVHIIGSHGKYMPSALNSTRPKVGEF